jgi:hypothetical protein
VCCSAVFCTVATCTGTAGSFSAVSPEQPEKSSRVRAKTTQNAVWRLLLVPLHARFLARLVKAPGFGMTLGGA